MGVSVYLSYLVKSSSKKPATFLSFPKKEAISSGRIPSVYLNLSLSNSLRRCLASVKIGENMAATAYLYQSIGLACCLAQCIIGSSLSKLSILR